MSVLKELDPSKSLVIPSDRRRFGERGIWTVEKRAKYGRNQLRHSSDLTIAEWAQLEPLIPSATRDSRSKSVALREVMNGLL